jgi:hypothetical protein
MSDSANLLLKRLQSAVEPHGALAEFCRKSGLPRKTVENWLNGTTIPTTALDAIAVGMETTPEDLLRSSKVLRLAPVADPRLALFGGVVSRLAAFDEAQLRFILPYVDAASELGGGTKGK